MSTIHASSKGRHLPPYPHPVFKGVVCTSNALVAGRMCRDDPDLMMICRRSGRMGGAVYLVGLLENIAAVWASERVRPL